MKRNKFSLSHYKIFSGLMGHLIPLTWYEVVPGDTIQHRTNMLLRVAPILAPLMHPVRVRIHHWFVPIRLLWEDYEDFFTGGEDGTETPEHPYVNVDGAVTEGSIEDYLGIPAEDYTGKDTKFSALPFRAYGKIWNDHYRDQQIHSLTPIITTSGADATAYSIAAAAWEKDYFTTIREDDDLGDEVHIPVKGIGKETQSFVGGGANRFESGGAPAQTYTFEREIDPATADESFFIEGTAGAGYPDVHVLVNDLRMAQGIHRYQEARNIYGARYVEYLKYCGVRRPSDARLQNPEYLGGGRQVIQFSEVLATADSGTYDVGDMLGHGIAAVRSNRYRRFFEEHGIVMSLMSVVPKHILMHQAHKGWFRDTKEDYFQKELQHVGEEEVLKKEIWNPNATATGLETFGYQGRYESYKSHPSSIAGEFRSSLNHWHMARDLGAMPTLNGSWINCSPTTRVYASASDHQIYCMANHSIQARRPMSYK